MTLNFTGSPMISANTQTYEAGIGDGTQNTSEIDFLTGTPTFQGFAGTGTSPTSFTDRQDATISDAIPVAEFGNGVAGMAYTIQSDGGSLTLSTTAANVVGSALTLNADPASGVVHINANLTGANALVSLSSTGSTIDIGSAGVTTTATSGVGQSYTGTLTDPGTGTLSLANGSTLNFSGAGPVGTGTQAIPTVASAITLNLTGRKRFY